MNSNHYDVVIVGGGIVGLATAYTLLNQRPSVRLLLLEKESELAFHQTGRNSGVIHSGLYYKTGSLKARFCMRGYGLLRQFCKEHGVEHDICGKLVVATNEAEDSRLDALHQRGSDNGLEGIRSLSAEELREREPSCAGRRALLIPQTGIVDYRAVAGVLACLIQDMGGVITLSEQVIGMKDHSLSGHSEVLVRTDKSHYRSKTVLVCAGIQSDRLARQDEPELSMRMIPFRGEYYELKPEAQYLVNHLIYPVPDPAFPFLGVHFTRMVSGKVECGPNAVLALAREGYGKGSINLQDSFETFSWPGFQRLALRYWKQGAEEFWRSWNKAAFVAALQKLVPSITADHLEPGASGIRAQACDREGNLLDDFVILERGRIVHICNAPSPAATASLAIAEEICRVASQRLDP